MLPVLHLTLGLLVCPILLLSQSVPSTFIHPGTVIAPGNIDKLPSITSSTDPVVQKGLKKLLEFADNSLKQGSQAKSEVRVLINPAAHDKEHGEKERNAYQDSVRKAKERGAVFASNQQFLDGDVKRILYHTYAYLITKKEEHAKKAIELIDSWSTVVKKFGPHNQNGPLVAAWGLVSLARAAELLKYRYPGWSSSPVEKNFIKFVDNILMPNLRYYEKNGKIIDFVAKGNWGSSIVEARLQYAIFRESREEFAWAIENHKMMFNNLFPFNNGRILETTRDIMHAQFGLGGLTGAAELFKHQGSDVYSMRDSLLRKSYEYHAGILLGERPSEIPEFRIVQFVSANWDIAFAHYHTQLGMEMPKSLTLLQQKRPEGFELGWGLGTLTHYPFAQKGQAPPPALSQNFPSVLSPPQPGPSSPAPSENNKITQRPESSLLPAKNEKTQNTNPSHPILPNVHSLGHQHAPTSYSHSPSPHHKKCHTKRTKY